MVIGIMFISELNSYLMCYLVENTGATHVYSEEYHFLRCDLVFCYGYWNHVYQRDLNTYLTVVFSVKYSITKDFLYNSLVCY